ncbi:MAG: DUF1887 family CARF protein [Methanothrix sp.]|nr:DUF1887 family CARF protein [Methanothrix sp.]MDI9399183.1 DUF1887 family CARF protein [Euryarchaeota archaeon]
MKLLLCLISDQHVPNLLSVHAVKPNLLLLVVSEKMKKDGVASNFLNALDLSDSYKNSALKHDIVDLKEENSIIATMNVLKTEFSKYPEAEWFVNITGGTKPMSIGAYEFFKDKDAHMLYIPIVSQSKAIDFSNGQSLELTYQLPIREFLAGYGFDFIKEENKVLEGETRAKKLFEFSIYLSEHYEFAHKMMKTLDLMIQEVYGGEKDKARNKARKKGIYLSNFGVQDQRLIDYLAYNFVRV